MGFLSKVQLIQRANQTRQFYLICPAPLAEALELEKGEPIEWVIEDRQTIILKRPTKPPAPSRRNRDAR